jgi:hypothetical protein
MIHMIGMSHLVNILRAFSAEQTTTMQPCSIGSIDKGAVRSGVLNNTNRYFRQLNFSLLPLTFTRFELVPSVYSTAAPKALVPTAMAQHFQSINQAIAQGQCTATIYCSILGTETFKEKLIIPPPRVDFVLPSRPHFPIDPDAQILPYRGLYAELVNVIARHTMSVYQGLIQNISHAKFVHIFPPPPNPSTELMINYAKAFISPTITMDMVSSPLLRLKFYLLYLDVMSQALSQAGIRWILPPDAGIDNCFLKLDYWYDHIHANVAYGELVLQQIEEDLRE